MRLGDNFIQYDKPLPNYPTKLSYIDVYSYDADKAQLYWLMYGKNKDKKVIGIDMKAWKERMVENLKEVGCSNLMPVVYLKDCEISYDKVSDEWNEEVAKLRSTFFVRTDASFKAKPAIINYFLCEKITKLEHYYKYDTAANINMFYNDMEKWRKEEVYFQSFKNYMDPSGKEMFNFIKECFSENMTYAALQLLFLE